MNAVAAWRRRCRDGNIIVARLLVGRGLHHRGVGRDDRLQPEPGRRPFSSSWKALKIAAAQRGIVGRAQPRSTALRRRPTMLSTASPRQATISPTKTFVDELGERHSVPTRSRMATRGLWERDQLAYEHAAPTESTCCGSSLPRHCQRRLASSPPSWLLHHRSDTVVDGRCHDLPATGPASASMILPTRTHAHAEPRRNRARRRPGAGAGPPLGRGGARRTLPPQQMRGEDRSRVDVGQVLVCSRRYWSACLLHRRGRRDHRRPAIRSYSATILSASRRRLTALCSHRHRSRGPALGDPHRRPPLVGRTGTGGGRGRTRRGRWPPNDGLTLLSGPECPPWIGFDDVSGDRADYIQIVRTAIQRDGPRGATASATT